MSKRKQLIVSLVMLIAAAGFRVAVAHWLPNDAPGDGVIYAQMARNVVEQHVYSHDTQPPYNPSLVRLPGYPLFLAGIYSIFGHTNNGAVRIVQALIDTATCGLIALLAFYWQPDEKRKRASALAALALAVICPFTTIYAATILTEVPTNFLLMAMLVAATLALRSGFSGERSKRPLVWWLVAGLLGGVSVFFRPDNGLFVAAVGLTLLVSSAQRIWRSRAERNGDGALDPADERAKSVQRGITHLFSSRSKTVIAKMLAWGTLFSLAFALVLVPWTIRNWRIFHIFQPLAPAHAEMPGEFVARGYGLWLRTWLDDNSYIAPMLWALDTDPIDIDDIPSYAFDSPAEKDRVAALIDKYNDPDGTSADADNSSQVKPSATPQPSPSPSPANTKASPNQKKSQSKANASGDEEDGDDSDEDQTNKDQHGTVEMTPEIDAGFAQIARERIARHPFQFYVWLPLKRARTMWFDTHSQYWPFEGTLLPFEDLDYEGHQQYWLPLFAGLTALYTLLGLAGAWALWSSGKFEARQWVLLVVLSIILRLILFSSIENPEPRYVVEFFPLLSILGGIAIGQFRPRMKATITDKK